MKNTFKVKVRGLGNRDYMLIEDVSTITSNLGGFLLTLKDNSRMQLDSVVEINIIGSDDASPLSIEKLESGITFDHELYPNSYQYVKEHNAGLKRCNMCGNVLLTNDNKDKPFQCIFCDAELTDQETHEGKPCCKVEFNELCNEVLGKLFLDN